MCLHRVVAAAALAWIVAVTGATAARAAEVNYQGLFWNAPAGSESGWGINIAHQGDVIFATWFTYDANGKALWLSMTATKVADGVYSGDIYQTRGPAFSAMPFRADDVTLTAVGTGTLTFRDVDNASFAYVVNGIAQTKTIMRQVFGPPPTCVFGAQADLARATNYQDLWWAAPAGVESGWGVNFTHQGDTIFATWFTYDTDGTPLWLSATLSRTAPGVYTGTLYRTRGPPFNAAPFLPGNVSLTAVGSLSVTFANGNSASFAYTVNGVTQTKQIVRQVFRTPGTVCHVGTTLPPISDVLPAHFRGATLGEWGDWSDLNDRGWQHIGDFPRWGGNFLSLIFSPWRFGEPVLAGGPLTNRVNAVLDKYSAVIDWALQHNVYVSLRFIQFSAYPRTPYHIWPDDGRILWTDASAQDEFVQAWTDVAKRFKGRKGILFNLLTEPSPHGFEIQTGDPFTTNVRTQDFVYRAWNALYPRAVAAIRAEDPERWIIVEPLFGDPGNFAASNQGFGFPDLAVSPDPKVMYEFHFYFPHYFTCQGCSGFYPPAGSVPYPGRTTDAPWEPEMYYDKSALEQRLQSAVAFRKAHDIRMIAGEFGSAYLAPMDSRVRWTSDVIDLLEKYGLDWAYFTYDGLGWTYIGDDWGPWDFDGTPIAPVVTSKYGWNLR